jgi:aminoglycoside phosphotransferase (APT) family kinase protein
VQHRLKASTTSQRAAEVLRAHAPELGEPELVELGSGIDNAVYTAGDIVLRVAHDRTVGREARLLGIVAAHVSIPIPTPRFADENAGVLAYELIPGRPLLGRPSPPGAAHQLGRFLRELHAIDPATVSDLVPTEEAEPDTWLDDLDGPDDLVRIVRATRPQPSGHRVVAHADLGAEHILELDGALTGIIDWSDAAITDPALDFARMYRDFGPAFLDELLHAYGGAEELMPRIEFFARCAALEDLAYGQTPGRRAYAVNAERSFAWLFPQRG